jgi:hypothetical protein
MMEGMNSTTIYSKNFCKCHNVPQSNNNKKDSNSVNKCISVSMHMQSYIEMSMFKYVLDFQNNFVH